MILVFGSQGQVGQALVQAMGDAPEHIFLHRNSRDYCGDLSNIAGITETLLELRPSIIINAAAYTGVDQAESEPDLVYHINAKAPAAIAQIASRLGALLVHYSSDYVFSGSGHTAWTETDPCAPISVYGASKFEGERFITESGARHFILRTSWVYSAHGRNFLKTMLELAESRDTLRVVSDQVGVPTNAHYIALATLDLLNLATPGFGSGAVTPPPSGIYHCAPAGETTWFDYARVVINAAKSMGKAQICKTITPVSTHDYPTAAKRPLNSRLDTSKLERVLKQVPPHWQESVVETVRHVLEGVDHDLSS